MRVQYGFVLLIAIAFCSCAPSYSKYIRNYETGATGGSPDYSNLYYWAAHPYKNDPSDSVPQPLRTSYEPDSVVDVFFVHPTTFTTRDDDRMNGPIHDAALNAKTDYSTILFQASVFNEQRVFAPRYRQAHLRSYYISDRAKADTAFELAYSDVRNAFEYYLREFNNGRPIILAAHSQGSTHAIRLLKEFFDGRQLSNRLVVAYLVGMNVPPNTFNSIRWCNDSLQTGCITGWRTYRKGFEPEFVELYRESQVTNPVLWTAGPEMAARDQHQGAVLRNFNKLVPRVTDAQVHNNILWVSRPKFPGSFLYRKANYHVGDINLFYMNIRSNVRTRINMFWKK